NQARPKIFDLSIRKPDVLYQSVIEIDERVILVNESECKSNLSNDVYRGISGEYVRVIKKLDRDKITKDLKSLYDDGFKSIAICLMHSYTFPEHEKQIGDTRLEFMQSDGGLVPVNKFSGFRAILSGPAGGVVGKCIYIYTYLFMMVSPRKLFAKNLY
ncbi:2009_t:CDS:2, partial [Entrophospora sp. SA101]